MSIELLAYLWASCAALYFGMWKHDFWAGCFVFFLLGFIKICGKVLVNCAKGTK